MSWIKTENRSSDELILFSRLSKHQTDREMERESGTGDKFVCRSEEMKTEMKVAREAGACVCGYCLEAGGCGGLKGG